MKNGIGIPQKKCEEIDCEHLGMSVSICSFFGERTKTSPRYCLMKGGGDKAVLPRNIPVNECAAIKDGRLRVVKKEKKSDLCDCSRPG